MRFHAIRNHPSCLPDGTCDPTIDPGSTTAVNFVSNGNLPAVGAPFHEPCMDDRGVRLETGVQGNFFGSTLTAMNDPAGMTTVGSSVFTANNPRIYKGANMQYDVVLNKAGYHYPQQRIIALWEDVVPVISKTKPDEPLVMRFNTFDCGVYHHTNLVPEYYELDDYQVRTPTDIIGQHIHLPKWDLTTADGAANGWNYEDGTLSPGSVRERIRALNCFATGDSGDPAHPCPPGIPRRHRQPRCGHRLRRIDPAHDPDTRGTPLLGRSGGGTGRPLPRALGRCPGHHPALVLRPGGQHRRGRPGTGHHLHPRPLRPFDPPADRPVCDRAGRAGRFALGAQRDRRAAGPRPRWSQPQRPHRWRSDLLAGGDPAAGWRLDRESARPAGAVPGVLLRVHRLPARLRGRRLRGCRPAGRTDRRAGRQRSGVDRTSSIPAMPISPACPKMRSASPSTRRIANRSHPCSPTWCWRRPQGLLPGCPFNPLTGEGGRPCPTAIDVQDPGMFSVNYRNEPVALRVFDPFALGPDGQPGAQSDARAGDLALAFETRNDRRLFVEGASFGSIDGNPIPGFVLNEVPVAGDHINGTVFPPHINAGGVNGGDPFTPMMRAFAGDLIRVKMQAGGDEEEHAATIHGVKWLYAGSGHGEARNSGWRGSQSGGISEQFTLKVPLVPLKGNVGRRLDYLYTMDASTDGCWSGMWGILRAYENRTQATDPAQGGGPLVELTNNPPPQTGLVQITNEADFDGACPLFMPDGVTPTTVRAYDITVVLANDVLPVNPDVIITDVDPAGHVGAAPDPLGGTLVYNPRTDQIGGGVLVEPGHPPVPLPIHNGPIHDPTAILYVHTSDVVTDRTRQSHRPQAEHPGRTAGAACRRGRLHQGHAAQRTAGADAGAADLYQPARRQQARPAGRRGFDHLPDQPAGCRPIASDCTRRCWPTMCRAPTARWWARTTPWRRSSVPTAPRPRSSGTPAISALPATARVSGR